MQDAQAALTSCALLAESTQGVMDQAKVMYPNVLAWTPTGTTTQVAADVAQQLYSLPDMRTTVRYPALRWRTAPQDQRRRRRATAVVVSVRPTAVRGRPAHG